MAIVVLDKGKIGEIKTALEESGYYDDSRKIGYPNDDMSQCTMAGIALPITDVCSAIFFPLREKQMPLPHPFEECYVSQVSLPPSKKSLCKNPKVLLNTSILKLLRKSLSEEEMDEMMKCIPQSWERHGDLVVLPPLSFSSPMWKSYLESLSASQLSSFWTLVSDSLKCKRLALGSSISCDGFRSSNATLLVGDNIWAHHVDNGIHYVFEVTKCMFSSGNISEKLRVAKFDCRGESVVDLYAGIGYFVLPYLVHAGALLVHACEWNPHAVEGLRRGLKANKVQERCIIHYGNNSEAGLINVADRVNVGLIPNSEDGWPVACAALKTSTGGYLHIHGNVTTKLPERSSEHSDQLNYERFSRLLSSKCLRCIPVTNWISYVVEQVLSLLQGGASAGSVSQSWAVEVRHVEHVKSYAPHISHLVLDLECRPSTYSTAPKT